MRARVFLEFARFRARQLMSSYWAIFALVFLHACSLATAGYAQAQTQPQGAAVNIHVPEAELTDQNGRTVHLYSDLVKGRKAVVIHTMFTTCGTICPLIGVRMGQLQKSLGACKANEYSLISISVDSTVDTPQRLREWGSKFGAGPCWRLLTGPKSDVDAVLKTLHLLPPDKLSHSPSALIGQDGAEDWTLFNVLASPDRLLRIVRMKESSSAAQKGMQP